MKFILSFLLVLMGLVNINAQKTYTVKGSVQDFHDKTMLENAEIRIGNFSAKTDKKGQFSLSGIPAGNYDLIAKHPENRK